MYYERFDGKQRELPLLVYNPWYDRRGHLFDHISEFGDVPAEKLPYMTPSPESDDPDIVAHRFYDHIHKELEVTFVVAGEWHVTVNGAEFDVSPGDVYIVNPFEKHSGVTYNRDYPKYSFTVIADMGYFARVMPERWQNKVSALARGTLRFGTVWRGCADMYWVFQNLHDCLTADDVPGALSWFYRLIGEMFGRFVATENGEPDPNYDFIVRVADIIEGRFREQISTGTVSAELGYSESYFCRRFRESFGTTFTERLNSTRIAYAKSLTLAESGSLQAIANECGVPDYVHFSKLFRKYTGMPPGKWYGA